MIRYSEERKSSVMRKLLPPENRTVRAVSVEEGISEVTLYTWRKQAKERGLPVPGSGKKTDSWSADAKFAVVVETAGLSETELSEYCRSKGLYPEQVKTWRQACIDGASMETEWVRQERRQTRDDKRRIKELERELRRKDKALAETAALLVLRKNKK